MARSCTPLGTMSTSIYTLDFPAFRAMRNKCLLFKPPCLWYFIIASQADEGNSLKIFEKRMGFELRFNVQVNSNESMELQRVGHDLAIEQQQKL